MPRLWSETIDAHRREVREAILDAVAELVSEHGLKAVTMSRIAERSGIGRATLYKYFPDVESILVAWHYRQVTGHLEQLREIRDAASTPGERLGAVLHHYAAIQRSRAGYRHVEPAAYLHRSDHVAGPRQRLLELMRDLLTEAAASGDVRSDVPPNELAEFCLHAIATAADLSSKEAVNRLLTVIRAGLNPGPASGIVAAES